MQGQETFLEDLQWTWKVHFPMKGHKVKHTCASVSVIVVCRVIHVFRKIDVEINSTCSS